MKLNVQKIEHRRKALGLKKYQLANSLGICPAEYTNYLTGKRIPRLGVIEKLYFALEMPLSDMFILDRPHE